MLLNEWLQLKDNANRMDALSKYVMWNFKGCFKEYCTDDAGRTSQQKFNTMLDIILGEKKKKLTLGGPKPDFRSSFRGVVLGMFCCSDQKIENVYK